MKRIVPLRGLSTPRALTVKTNKIWKTHLVTKYEFSVRNCTIVCMREVVTISYGSRILPSPLASKTT